jgi:hypothetical protein
VLHIGRPCTVAQRGGAYYIEAPEIPPDDKTWCGRRVSAVNCVSTKCAYSKDELCVSCLGKTSACEETTA